MIQYVRMYSKKFLISFIKPAARKFKRYEPYKYWNNRKDPNNKEGRTLGFLETHIDFIKKHTAGYKTVFELGPGVGRTFGAYEKGMKIKSLDLSKSYQNTIYNEAKKRGLKLDQHFLSNVDDDFPFIDNEFPVGVISQVLLHIPPKYIYHTIKECLRICDRLVIITAYRHGEKTSNNSHCFNHDYVSIFSDLGCLISNLKTENNQVLFTVEKNKRR